MHIYIYIYVTEMLRLVVPLEYCKLRDLQKNQFSQV